MFTSSFSTRVWQHLQVLATAAHWVQGQMAVEVGLSWIYQVDGFGRCVQIRPAIRLAPRHAQPDGFVPHPAQIEPSPALPVLEKL
jgi:hypothetical protein